MMKEEILKEQILANYGSIREFAKQLDIPESTIRNIFSRGLDGVGVGTAIKICKALNLDIESLMQNQFSVRPNQQKDSVWQQFANAANAGEFSQDDLDILALLPIMSSEQKKSLGSFLRALAAQRSQDDVSHPGESEGEAP